MGFHVLSPIRSADRNSADFDLLERLKRVSARALRRTAMAAASVTVATSLGVVGLAGIGASSPAKANDQFFQIGYTVQLNGLRLGKGQLAGRMLNGAYRLQGQTGLAGIVGAFYDYSASGEVDGLIGRSLPAPRNFDSTASEDDSSQHVRMSFSGKNVADLSLRPKPRRDTNPNRIHIQPQHMRNVIDPMSAMIMPVVGSGPMDAQNCQRTIPIFNGRERFNIKLSHKGFSDVAASQNRDRYAGRAIVCRAIYEPIAGHRKNRREVEYFAKTRDIEVWMIPAGDTGLMLPYRIVVPTPIGWGVIQSTQFRASGHMVSRTSLR